MARNLTADEKAEKAAAKAAKKAEKAAAKAAAKAEKVAEKAAAERVEAFCEEAEAEAKAEAAEPAEDSVAFLRHRAYKACAPEACYLTEDDRETLVELCEMYERRMRRRRFDTVVSALPGIETMGTAPSTWHWNGEAWASATKAAKGTKASTKGSKRRPTVPAANRRNPEIMAGKIGVYATGKGRLKVYAKVKDSAKSWEIVKITLDDEEISDSRIGAIASPNQIGKMAVEVGMSWDIIQGSCTNLNVWACFQFPEECYVA